MTAKNIADNGFENLGLSEKILQILKQNNFITPTPIQHKCIPIVVEGKDVVGVAQTGTGKTLAFGLPMIQRLSKINEQGLILLPTRELALQVDEVLRKIGSSFGLKTSVLIGGASMQKQIYSLRARPHIIVATPGRLVDHLEQKNISLKNVKIAVLDEADRMLDIGFMPQIIRILKLIPEDKQMLMFSATMPAEISKLAMTHMKMPLRIEVAPAGTPAENVEQEIFILPREFRMALLNKILSDSTGSVLVFSRTKRGAAKIAHTLRDKNFSAAEIHSDRSLYQRRQALDGFKSGRFRVLVATDIAARGIDVSDIALVINYDLPDNSDDYVHRIGRTGRAGSSGKAISFATPQERGDIKAIEKLIKKTIPVSGLPALSDLPKINMSLRQDEERARPRGNFKGHGFKPRRSQLDFGDGGYSKRKSGFGRSGKRPFKKW